MSTQEQEPLINACPECGEAIDVSDQPPYAKIECPHCKSSIRVRTLLGQYQIERLLGEGGMSQVFLARDETLGRSVALKVLHKELSRDKKLTDSFEREAKITASINHPNVVKVYTVGSDYGYFFIAMELMDNVSLEELITKQERVPEKQVMQIACDVTNGLNAAFKAGLIHRDIKPGNILLTDDGTAKLVDFGLAVQAGHFDADEDVWATPFYVPPEKLEGEPDDFRGDIYSLGATLFHAVSGTPPYAANTASLDELKKIKAKTIRLIDSVPKARKQTCNLIDRMMARNPAERHQNYKDLLAELNHAAAKLGRRTYGSPGMVDGMDEDSRKPLWKRPAVVVLGIVILLATVLGLVFMGSKEDDLSESLLAGGEDRVLVAGEQNTAARYAAARGVLEKGDFGEAGEAFGSLLGAEDLKGATRGWTEFNLGLCLLLEGKEQEARVEFLKLAKSGDNIGADAGTIEVMDFLKQVGRILGDVLPVRNSDLATPNGDLSYQGIAYLAAGLKNWNQGRFESALRFFRQFQAASFPEPYTWIESLKGQVAVYQQDGAILKDLPNPHLSMSNGDLDKAKTQLLKAKEKLASGGAAPLFVEARIARIQGLIDEKQRLASLPPQKPLANVAANEGPASGDPPPAGNAASMSAPPPVPTVTVPTSTPDEFEPSGEVLEELKKLWATEEVAQGLGANFEFPQALSRFERIEVKTPLGMKLLADEMQILKQAELFLSMLVAKLNEGKYEGVVIRKEGKPLEARITGATRETLTVDLGFGGNQVALVEFAPSWLLAVARELLGDAESSPEIIGNAGCFAWATGETETARQLIAKSDAHPEEFKGMWERMMKYRPH